MVLPAVHANDVLYDLRPRDAKPCPLEKECSHIDSSRTVGNDDRTKVEIRYVSLLRGWS